MARDMTVHSKCAPVQEAQRQEELCPAGCGEVEGNLHYMFCHHCDMKDKRDDLLADLCTELHRHHTSPALISTLSAALKELGATGSVTMPSGNSSDPIEEDLAMALELQDDILRGHSTDRACHDPRVAFVLCTTVSAKPTPVLVAAHAS